MFHLFTSVGISLLKNVMQWAAIHQQSDWTRIENAYEACLKNDAKDWQMTLLRDLILRRFAATNNIHHSNNTLSFFKNPSTFKLSAEIQSIHQLLLHPKWKDHSFHLHLLATDSQASPLVAELLASYYDNHPFIKIVIVKRIEGLQINRSDQFKDEGIQALVEYIHNTKKKPVARKGKQERLKAILNITGGYKGVTPILTIIGQLLDLPLLYLYEQSDKLIEIPPLPLSFDWTKLEIYQYCFARLQAHPLPSTQSNGTCFNLQIFKEQSIKEFIKKEMIENALIKEVKPGLSCQITFLGYLLRHHIDEVCPAGTKALGLAFEFLFFELFVNEPFQLEGATFTQVVHNKIMKEQKDREGKVQIKEREFDLELRSPDLAANEFVICEICSYGQLTPLVHKKKWDYYFRKQLTNQLKTFKKKAQIPWAYILLVYSYEGLSQWDKIDESFADIAKKLKADQITRFKTFGLSLPLKVSSKNNKNPYSNLYQKKLTFDKQQWRAGNSAQYGNPWLWLRELKQWKEQI